MTSARRSLSTRWAPVAMQTTGSPSQTKTSDLAIWAVSQPTASAAWLTVAVEESSLRTSTSSPSRRALSITLSRTNES